MPLYGEDNFFVEQECFRNAKERRSRVLQIEQYIYIFSSLDAFQPILTTYEKPAGQMSFEILCPETFQKTLRTRGVRDILNLRYLLFFLFFFSFMKATCMRKRWKIIYSTLSFLLKKIYTAISLFKNEINNNSILTIFLKHPFKSPIMGIRRIIINVFILSILQ